MDRRIRYGLITVSIITLALIIFGLAPIGSCRPWWLLELKRNVSEFQTLIGGALALAAGALAYFGLREQILRSGEDRKEDIHRREKEASEARDERINEQNARAAAIAAQLAFASKLVFVPAHYARVTIDAAVKNEATRQPLMLEVRGSAYQRTKEQIAVFDETFRWTRDALIEVRAITKRNLTLQVERCLFAVRDIEVAYHNIISGPDHLLPDSRDRDQLEKNANRLNECAKILDMIVDKGGATSDEQIVAAVEQQNKNWPSKEK